MSTSKNAREPLSSARGLSRVPNTPFSNLETGSEESFALSPRNQVFFFFFFVVLGFELKACHFLPLKSHSQTFYF
jgi:hypothetical protein